MDNQKKRDRAKSIEFHLNYCQHYTRNETTRDMVCSAGMDLQKIKRVPVGDDKIKWGPCIRGHLLENPTAHCPHWIRRTQESAEKYADAIERALTEMEMVMPFVNAWRSKPPKGKQEVVECPVCKGRLHLSQSSYNGHVHGQCETEDCVNWME